MVSARNARPAAASPTPIQSRFATVRPNRRSANTVSRTSPPAITAWTIEIGASDSAATWKPHDVVAMTQPSRYHFDLNSTSVEWSGRFQSTSGDSTAPRCL
jgi:hypothetical protein